MQRRLPFEQPSLRIKLRKFLAFFLAVTARTAFAAVGSGFAATIAVAANNHDLRQIHCRSRVLLFLVLHRTGTVAAGTTHFAMAVLAAICHCAARSLYAC